MSITVEEILTKLRKGQQAVDILKNTPKEKYKCVCDGNFREIVIDTEPLFETKFKTQSGEICTLHGVLFASDDFYYCLTGNNGRCILSSCVGSLEDSGFIKYKKRRSSNGVKNSSICFS